MKCRINLGIVLLIMIGITVSCKKTAEDEEQTVDLTFGLQAHFTLNGNVNESVHGDTGIASGTIVPVVDHHGHLNGAMMFSSVQHSMITFESKPWYSPGQQFSLCFWAKPMDTTNAMAIVSKRLPGGPFEFSADSHFGLSALTLDNWIADATHPVYGTDPLKAAAGLVPGNWHHYAWVADGNFLRVYQDGVLMPGTDTLRTGSFFTPTAAPLVIGNGGGFGRNYYFDGAIDDIRLYTRTLKVSEVIAVMNQ